MRIGMLRGGRFKGHLEVSVLFLMRRVDCDSVFDCMECWSFYPGVDCMACSFLPGTYHRRDWETGNVNYWFLPERNKHASVYCWAKSNKAQAFR